MTKRRPEPLYMLAERTKHQASALKILAHDVAQRTDKRATAAEPLHLAAELVEAALDTLRGPTEGATDGPEQDPGPNPHLDS